MSSLYEQSIRIVHWFFGALVALALTHLYRDRHLDPNADIWPAFILCTLFFIRYLVGSANHMWHEYVRPPGCGRAHVRLFKDFLFVVVFGFVAIQITDSRNVKALLGWCVVLLIIAVCWTIFGLLIETCSPGIRKKFGPYVGNWNFWFWINVLQLLLTFPIYLWWEKVDSWRLRWPDWSGALALLAVAYFLLLVWDVNWQFRVLEAAKDPAPAGPAADTTTIVH